MIGGGASLSIQFVKIDRFKPTIKVCFTLFILDVEGFIFDTIYYKAQ
ncbi:hypothetical protein LPICM17_70018 [Lactococcus piscium]|nr:hypothetical protein LP2241_10282 [Lactococcus piscium]SOB48944.1 hypothetical protein LPICM17_70018 [Lactococcus piscium]